MSAARVRGSDSRGQLLEAAVAVIAEDGWAAATSRVVADRAGVNNAMVHYHFGSIDALRRAAVWHAIEAELAGPMAAMMEAGDLLDGITDVVGRLAAEGAGTPGNRVLAEALVQSLRDDEIREGLAQALHALREMLTSGFIQEQQAGRLRGDADPAALAVVIAALIDGLLLHVFADPALDVRSPTEALAGLLRPAGYRREAR
ncbi:MAG TPA: helix-turn-helix domain-containing protein [Streptosporangiaceae bacterium]